ncbi:MAG: DUF2190 family protein [Candidatus Kapaibacterium sp.]
MALHNKTYQPVQSLTVAAAEDLPAYRFVAIGGSLCTAGELALGVTDLAWLSGENASVVSLGTIVVETSGAVTAGDDVAADASGKAKTAEAGNAINGRALDGTTGAGFVKIKLVP